jgi:hypothetical protein
MNVCNVLLGTEDERGRFKYWSLITWCQGCWMPRGGDGLVFWVTGDKLTCSLGFVASLGQYCLSGRHAMYGAPLGPTHKKTTFFKIFTPEPILSLPNMSTEPYPVHFDLLNSEIRRFCHHASTNSFATILQHTLIETQGKHCDLWME